MALENAQTFWSQEPPKKRNQYRWQYLGDFPAKAKMLRDAEGRNFPCYVACNF